MKPIDQQLLRCSTVIVFVWLVLSLPCTGQASGISRSNQRTDGLAGHVHRPVEETYDKEKSNARIIVSKVYDRAGHLTELDVAITDKNAPEIDTKQHSIFVLDQLGRRTETRTYRDDGPLASTTVYSYDDQGHPLQTVKYRSDDSEEIKWVYAYDSNGNENEAKYYVAGIIKARYVREHDERGNVITIVAYKKDGSKEYIGRTRYDTKNRRTEELVYNPNGLVERRRTYAYDSRDNVFEKKVFLANGSVLEKELYDYEFDSVGNWIKRTTTHWQMGSGQLELQSTQIIRRNISYYTE